MHVGRELMIEVGVAKIFVLTTAASSFAKCHIILVSQLPPNMRAIVGKLFALLSVIPLALSISVKPSDMPDAVVHVFPVSGEAVAGEFHCPFMCD
jgi:hypothetical protein